MRTEEEEAEGRDFTPTLRVRTDGVVVDCDALPLSEGLVENLDDVGRRLPRRNCEGNHRFIGEHPCLAHAHIHGHVERELPHGRASQRREGCMMEFAMSLIQLIHQCVCGFVHLPQPDSQKNSP